MSTYNKVGKVLYITDTSGEQTIKAVLMESSWLTFDDHFKSGIQVTGSGGHSDCLYAESCRNKLV
jgi:uncharacterized protein with ATP-grasp and redox domains